MDDMLIETALQRYSPEGRAYAQRVVRRKCKADMAQRAFFSPWKESEDYEAMVRALAEGRKPSAFFQEQMAWMFGSCILERHREAFLWAADHCLDWPYPIGWTRRPLRSPHYVDHCDALRDMARHFFDMAVVDADV